MKSFVYVARNEDAEQVTGVLEAADRREALGKLGELGLFPVHLHEMMEQGPAGETDDCITVEPFQQAAPADGAVARLAWWIAVGSLALGILGILAERLAEAFAFPLVIAAAVCGGLAMRGAGATAEGNRGKGMAVAGLALGCLGVALCATDLVTSTLSHAKPQAVAAGSPSAIAPRPRAVPNPDVTEAERDEDTAAPRPPDIPSATPKPLPRIEPSLVAPPTPPPPPSSSERPRYQRRYKPAGSSAAVAPQSTPSVPEYRAEGTDEGQVLDMAAAIASGKVSARFRGNGGSSGDVVEVTFSKRYGGDGMVLTVTPGTRLRSGTPGIQGMVLAGVKGEKTGVSGYYRRESMVVDATPRTYVLEAYCAEFSKGNPTSSTLLWAEGVDPMLGNILRETSVLSLQAKQAAVWMHTDWATFQQVNRKFRVSGADWIAAEAAVKRCMAAPYWNTTPRR